MDSLGVLVQHKMGSNLKIAVSLHRFNIELQHTISKALLSLLRVNYWTGELEDDFHLSYFLFDLHFSTGINPKPRPYIPRCLCRPAYMAAATCTL